MLDTIVKYGLCASLIGLFWLGLDCFCEVVGELAKFIVRGIKWAVRKVKR